MSHNQDGYSESSIATGSAFAFKKFNPFNGVPAGTEERTKGESVFLEESLGLRPWPTGEMEMGVVKGSVALEGEVGAGDEVVVDWVR